MAEEAARSRLGRGLAALIGDVGTESSAERPRGQRRQPTSSLRPNARNPRRNSPTPSWTNSTASLRERGIIQPIVARPVRGAPDAYEIIAGERRWRAAQRAGLHEVPVVIIEATDEEALQLAIIENVQRADLNPLEEAEGYRALMEEFSHSQDDIAKIVGKSRSHVANTLRLLKLPPIESRPISHNGKLDRRPCAHAGRRSPMPKSSRKKSSRAASMCAKSRRSRAQESGRNGKPHSPQALGGEKRRHAGAGKAVVRRARSRRQHRRTRRKRRASASAIATSISSTIWRSAWRKSSITARVLSGKLSKALGQQVYVDNRTGAGGTIATEQVALAAPDGLTLLMTPLANAANETLFKNFRYTYDDYFTAVAPVADTNNVVVAHPSLHVKTIGESHRYWQNPARQARFWRDRPGSELLRTLPTNFSIR